MPNLQNDFSKLYDNWVDKIYRFVFIKVNSQEIAEDLTSETFMKGWQSYKAKASTIDNPVAFLYQIARNLVTDYYREKGKARTISTESTQIPDPRNNFEEKAINALDLNTIKNALVDMREDYQELIAWHYIDDLSISEIGGILGKPEGTIRVTLHRALKALKEKVVHES